MAATRMVISLILMAAVPSDGLLLQNTTVYEEEGDWRPLAAARSFVKAFNNAEKLADAFIHSTNAAPDLGKYCLCHRVLDWKKCTGKMGTDENGDEYWKYRFYYVDQGMKNMCCKLSKWSATYVPRFDWKNVRIVDIGWKPVDFKYCDGDEDFVTRYEYPGACCAIEKGEVKRNVRVAKAKAAYKGQTLKIPVTDLYETWSTNDGDKRSYDPTLLVALLEKEGFGDTLECKSLTPNEKNCPYYKET